MSNRNEGWINKFLNRFAKRHWRVLAGGALFILFLEIFEILHKHEPLTDPFHLTELALYLFFLALVGVLFNTLVKVNAAQNRTMELLHYKHGTSLELTETDDWDTLSTKLAELPGKFVSIEASRLRVLNPISGKLEEAACWNEEGLESTLFRNNCQECLQTHANTEVVFSPCVSPEALATAAGSQSMEYCLPITYANSLLALIQFKLKPGVELTKEHEEIFESIRPEIALALRASKEQERLAELRLAEAALAERHSISTYLHDNLSQNLAYLCLKLDQFTAGEEHFSEDEWNELQHMKDTANLSYDIVRGMIETIHPTTTPLLVNLIVAYSKKVSQRANIEVNVKKEGKSLPLPPEVQQMIFYVFQEALSNVEKHAEAGKTDVLIDWGQESLTVTVSDNGIGFDPEQVDRNKHFGLEIMQERIEKVNGRIDFQSSENSGTKITIFVPVAAIKKENK